MSRILVASTAMRAAAFVAVLFLINISTVACLSLRQEHIAAPEPEPVVRLPPMAASGYYATLPLAARDAASRSFLSRAPHVEARGSTYATAALLVQQSLIAKITDAATPLLEHVATSIAIPAQDTDHYSFPAFHLQNFTLGTAAVNFIAPNQIQATFTNVSLVVPSTPFYVYEAIFGHKIGCHGTFGAVTSNTWLQLTLTLERSPLNGTLLVQTATAKATFGSLSISHTFESDICKIAGAVLGFFFGGLNTLLKDLVEDMLPPKIAHIAQNKTNEVMDSSPLRLAAEPNITSASLELIAELLPSNATPPSVTPPNWQQFPTRDVEVYVSEQSLNTLIAVKSAEGDFNGDIKLPAHINTSSLAKLLPKANQLCNDCLLSASYATLVPPFAVVGAASVEVAVMQLQVTIGATPPNATAGTAATQLMQLSVDVGLELTNLTATGSDENVIYFQVQLPSLSATVTSSSIGKLDIPVLIDIMKFVLSDVVLKYFNEHFKGYALPLVDGFDVHGVVLALSDAQIALALDIHVPSPIQ